MSTRIDLPDNAWAQLRDPKKVPERLRRPYSVLSAKLAQLVVEPEKLDQLKGIDAVKALGAEGTSLGKEIQDVVALALVEAWSYDEPVTLEAIADLPGDAYDALARACSPLAKQMFVSSDPSPDPASPSEPSQP